MFFNCKSKVYDTLKYIFIVANQQLEVDPDVIALMLKTSNPDIAEKVTYVAPYTKKWIPIEREISDSDNASVMCSLPKELCIIKAPAK